jgi:hypothetical protein
MRFDKWFGAHKVDAWRQNYVRYKRLKALVKQGSQLDFSRFASEFSSEIIKVDQFYTLIHAAFLESWEQYRDALESQGGELAAGERNAYQEAIEGLYTGLTDLYMFATVNYRAGTRLLQFLMKHSASNNQASSEQMTRLTTQLMDAEFAANPVLNKINNSCKKLIREIEQKYAQLELNSDVASAKRVLKSWRRSKQLTTKNSFLLGVFIGAILILALAIGVYSGINGLTAEGDSHFACVFPMFRGLIILSLYALLLGWNVYIWTDFNINFKHLLKFRLNFSPAITFLMRGSMISAVVMMSLLWYVFTRIQAKESVLDAYMPLISWSFILLWIFIPVKYWFAYSGRTFIARIILESVIAPFSKVEFRHVFCMDQFVSLTVPFLDIQYTICFYIHGGSERSALSYCTKNLNLIPLFVAFIPYMIRLLQCLRLVFNARTLWHRQTANAGKYLSSMVVILISFFYRNFSASLLYVWIAAAFISAVYSCYWDLTKDWGLLQNKQLLRDKLIYKDASKYYVIIVVNLLLRLSWTLTISPVIVDVLSMPDLVSLITGLLEVCRRIQWNIVRMEWEELQNKENPYKVLGVTKDTIARPHLLINEGEKSYLANRAPLLSEMAA